MYTPFPFSPKNKKNISLKESILDHIKFLIYSKKGEYKYDYDLGCEIWTREYQNLSREDIKKFIEDSLQKEKRLKLVQIENDSEGIVYDKSKQLLKITIKGILPNNDTITQELRIPININVI